MKTFLKVVLIAMVGGVLLIGAIVVGGYLWFQKNVERGRMRELEGKAFGEGRASDACLEEAFRRLDRADGLLPEIETKIFFSACLRFARQPDGFCDGVPPKDEFVETATWVLERCGARRASYSEQRCSRLFQAMQEHCTRTPEDPAQLEHLSAEKPL